MYFLSHLRMKLWQRIRKELPEAKNIRENEYRSNNHKKNRSKNHSKNRANNQRR